MRRRSRICSTSLGVAAAPLASWHSQFLNSITSPPDGLLFQRVVVSRARPHRRVAFCWFNASSYCCCDVILLLFRFILVLSRCVFFLFLLFCVLYVFRPIFHNFTVFALFIHSSPDFCLFHCLVVAVVLIVVVRQPPCLVITEFRSFTFLSFHSAHLLPYA